MEETQIVILCGDERLKIKALYNEHRSAFFAFGRKYGLKDDSLSDIYQEAFLALRKHAINGKLTEVKSSLKTYLFGIGKYMIFDTLKKMDRSIPLKSNLYIAEEDIIEIAVDSSESLTHEQQLLRTYFKKLGEKCRQVLTLFYYRGLTIDEIVQQAGYDNPNVVKAQKSRCLKTLKEMINS